MRKLFIILSIILIFMGFSSISILLAQTSPASDIYCTSTNGCGVYISSVTFGGINNSGTACSASGYGNYISMNTTVGSGQTVLITVTGVNSNASTYCGAWIDWNQNGLLTDLGESVALSGSPGVGPYTANVTVPAGAVLNTTRLRVRISQSQVVPCGNLSQGETEDYSLVVQPVVAMGALGTTQLCSGQHLNINVSAAYTLNAGNQFLVQLSDDFGSFASPTVIGTYTGTTSCTIPCYIPPDTPGSGSYRIRVTATNPVFTSANNGADLMVITGPDLQITNPSLVCPGTNVNITTSWSDQNYTGGTVSYWRDSLCTLSLLQPAAVGLAGNYYIRMNTSDGCIAIKPVLVSNFSTPLVNAGPDNTVNIGGPFTFSTTVTGGDPPFTYNWSPASSLNDPYLLNPVASPMATTTYSLCVNDSHGCLSCDQITLMVASGGNGFITGGYTYDNTNHTAMSNITVYLKDSLGNPVSQTTTDANGYYSFMNVSPGGYKISASCNKIWGGVNAVDALLIARHFVGLVILTGFRVTVADVNNNGAINSVDALSVNKRFVGTASSFPTGDWKFETISFHVFPGSNLSFDLKALCFGDVNGSYIPPFQ